MNKIALKCIITVFLVFLFAGCTHKINISPNINDIAGKYTKKDKNQYNVAYYLPKEKENIYLISGGGGGDSVGYFPYKETESSFRTVLNNLFDKVYKIDTFPSKEFLRKNNIKYVFYYEIETQSFSNSSFTWPPTNFIVNLKTTARDENNDSFWEDALNSQGFASFNEFNGDFGLSGKRAIINAFNTLYYRLKTSEEFKCCIN